MALSSSSRPSLRARVLSRLPATLQASGGLQVEKVAGVWTFSPDWTTLVLEETVPEPSERQVWAYNAVDESYSRIAIDTLIGGVVDIGALTPADSTFIVGDGTNWVAETGDTARVSMGVGSTDSPQFTAVNVGHATDTTITRVAAGRLAVEGVGLVKGPASAVASNAAAFSGTTGDLLADSGKAFPSGTIVGTSDSQAITNKTYNGLTITSTTGTFTIAAGKTLTASNTLTLTGTDGSSVAFGTGGTVIYNGGALGTPSSGTATNLTGLPIATGVSGLGTGIATALAVNTGSAGAPVLLNGAGGTPTSLTLTNATGLPTAGLVNSAVTLAKIQNAAGNSKLVGSGASGSGAAYTEITLGTNLSMSGTTLNAAGGGSGGREVLGASRTYYVRTDGSDSNDGLTNASGGAFLTIQKAIDTTVALDLAGYAVTIQIGNTGSYAGFTLNKPFVGGLVTVIGDVSAAGSYVITSAITVSNNAALSIRGVDFTLTGYALTASFGGQIYIDGAVIFGVCSSGHMYATWGGMIICTVSHTIDGGTANHIYASFGGQIFSAGVTVTLTGTPAFSSYFANVEGCSVAQLNGNTYSGSGTGNRYYIQTNGVIQTYGGGGTYLPGNVAGATATGGQYA